VELARAAELVRFGSSIKFGAFTACLGFELWLRAVTGMDTGTEAPGAVR
jgi:hypothetical protein